MEIATGVLGSSIVSLASIMAVASVISLPLLSTCFSHPGAVAMLLAVTAFARYWPRRR